LHLRASEVRQFDPVHSLIARSIETLFPTRLEEFYGVLAYHFGHAEDWDKAREYLLKAGDQAGRLAGDAEALAHYQQALEIHERILGDRWDPAERATLERKMGEVLFRRPDYDSARRYFERAIRRAGGFYPSSGFRLPFVMLAQAGHQMTHRMLPRRAIRRRTVAHQRAMAEERTRIYERMLVMEYMLDQQRRAAIALLMLNDAEAADIPYGMALGSDALAVRHGDLATSGDENGRPHRRPERGEGYFQIRLMKKAVPLWIRCFVRLSTHHELRSS
jgi:tetratricopeptide (TPR) repeat protein